MLLPLYHLATYLGGPLIAYHLRRRVRLGKEDATRLGERFGKPSIPRPDGPLVWFHAASVGETLAALPLIEALLAARPSLQVLLTTGTVTSAKLIAIRLPERMLHQFVPVDQRSAWHAFLSYWRPDAGFLVESEIWPNLIIQAEAFGLPLTVINGRMSQHSFDHWRRIRGTAKRLFGALTLCLARNDDDGERFRLLGAGAVRSIGDLKHAAPPLPVDDKEFARWRGMLDGRKIWLAASTHPGEESKILDIHKALTGDFPGLLTIIVPRHPERGDELAGSITATGLQVAQRSRQMIPDARTDIYLGDSVGELGLFYRLAPIVFIGGSLIPHGGQNPLEAARLDSAILFGPETGNFEQITETLVTQEAAKRISDANHLDVTLRQLMDDQLMVAKMADRAQQVVRGESAVLHRVLSAIMPFIDRKSEGRSSSCDPAIKTADARA